MKILFAISEAYPFVKSALQAVGTEVRMILPKYSSIAKEYSNRLEPVADFSINLAWRKIRCTLERMEHQGVVCYFLGNDYYFCRNGFYGYDDDGERFAFFCKAVLESLIYLNYQPDIIHCHDWHTALIPLLLKEHFGCHPYYFGIKTVLTIHNLKYQGILPLGWFEDVLGLGGHQAAWSKLEYEGSLNYLKAGILAADMLTTVSPTYANEIQNPYYGENLASFLCERRVSLFGIINGIDTVQYDPENDQHLFVNFRTSMPKKKENKERLQALLKLPVEGDAPLLAMVSRLVEMKGMDLVVHILDELLNHNVQLVVLGTGDRRYEMIFRHFAAKYPRKLSLRLGFDEALAHKIYGGADLLLMPSQAEPCGLSQMIAMRYGTLPIVRETGGLKDTVIPFNEYTGAGNGFSFANYNAHELFFTVQRAIRLYTENKQAWNILVKKAMASDFSWEKSARRYQKLYQSIM